MGEGNAAAVGGHPRYDSPMLRPVDPRGLPAPEPPGRLLRAGLASASKCVKLRRRDPKAHVKKILGAVRSGDVRAVRGFAKLLDGFEPRALSVPRRLVGSAPTTAESIQLPTGTVRA